MLCAYFRHVQADDKIEVPGPAGTVSTYLQHQKRRCLAICAGGIAAAQGRKEPVLASRENLACGVSENCLQRVL